MLSVHSELPPNALDVSLAQSAYVGGVAVPLLPNVFPVLHKHKPQLLQRRPSSEALPTGLGRSNFDSGMSNLRSDDMFLPSGTIFRVRNHFPEHREEIWERRDAVAVRQDHACDQHAKY